MKKTLGWILPLLVIVWGAATLGVGPVPIIGVAWADQHGEEEEKDKAETESGPSLDALDAAIESSTGAEGNFRLPEGGGGAAGGGGEGGSVLDRLRGRLGAVPTPTVGGGGTPDLSPVSWASTFMRSTSSRILTVSSTISPPNIAEAARPILAWCAMAN